MSIDFSQSTMPQDRVAVVATQPLTDNEEWTRLAGDELDLFESGMPVRKGRRDRAGARAEVTTPASAGRPRPGVAPEAALAGC